MEKITIFLFITFYASGLYAQTPDWSSQVAAVIYANCSTCHHEGGIAPFPLMSYEDAVTYAFSIQADVNAHKMPPWPPDPSYNHFLNEKVLSPAEISTISNWVSGGMPSGNLALAPMPPVFSGNSMMTEIDTTIQFPAYTVQDEEDEYRTFVIHSGYTKTKYLNQVEFIPGNPSIVHHVFLFQDTSDVSWQKDLDDPQPGFAGGGLGGFSPGASLICGWIPGSEILKLPANMAFKVRPGADFVISVHYAPGSYGQSDSMKINFKYSDADEVRRVSDYRLLYYHTPSLMNPPFEIPANEVKTFYEQSPLFKTDQSLIALQPHMHLIGRTFKVYMVDPNGDTTNLLYIPDWSFHWQMDYFLTKIMKVPKDAQIFGEGFYDNTINNPNNPNNPPETIHAGESTFSEMMGCHFSLMDYLPGDENIILDSSFYIPTSAGFENNLLHLEVFPNPANHVLQFVADIPDHEILWTLSNETGVVMKTSYENKIANGLYVHQINVDGFSGGLYTLCVISGEKQMIKNVLIVD